MKYTLVRVSLSFTAFIYVTAAMAQCTICRDATAGSAPLARAGLRLAIPVLGIPALILFSTLIALAFRKDRHLEDVDEGSNAPKDDEDVR